MKKKIIAASILTATTLFTAVAPKTVFADVNNSEGNKSEIDINYSNENNVTTGSAITVRKDINDTTTGSAIEVKRSDTHTLTTTESAVDVDENIVEVENKMVSELKVAIDGDVIVGKTISVDVKGFDALGDIVKLDFRKLSYKWYAKDLDKNKDLVGDNKELEITSDMDKKYISCDVTYDN